MRELGALHCNPAQAEQRALQLAQALDQGDWVQLLPPVGTSGLIPRALLPDGPGVVVASGGTSGGQQHCLQPCSHLDLSASATGQWLQQQGYDLQQCMVLNPLPLHHVSGLMSWWRSRCWRIGHAWLQPGLMRDPDALEQLCGSLPGWGEQLVLMSLVPTQLQRLLTHNAGVRVLKACAVIWVGGAVLSPALMKAARAEGLRLAPCYGSTETAAMVTALAPEDFLAGATGCGSPLEDVELQLTQAGALQVRTARLALARWLGEGLEDVRDQQGWWTSGDAGCLITESNRVCLSIAGRLDGAIHSGGETVFPEQLEARLQVAAVGLPVEAVLLLAVEDREWGQRLVALVRPAAGANGEDLIKQLRHLCVDWPPADRPMHWRLCPMLAPMANGKWQRGYWQQWLRLLEAESTEF